MQERSPDAWNCPSGVFLWDTWAQLLCNGEKNNHRRLPKLPWGSSEKFLLHVPPEAFPAAWGSLSRDLHTLQQMVLQEREHRTSPLTSRKGEGWSCHAQREPAISPAERFPPAGITLFNGRNARNNSLPRAALFIPSLLQGTILLTELLAQGSGLELNVQPQSVKK